MGQDVIMCSAAVCYFAPHSQAAVKAIPICAFLSGIDQRWSIPLRVTHAGRGKLNPSDVGLTSLRNVWSQEVFSHHSLLHLYSAYQATLMPNWVGLFNSSSAADTNECLDLSCCSCPSSGDRSLSNRRCSGF